jgi:hypothetical protein
VASSAGCSPPPPSRSSRRPRARGGAAGAPVQPDVDRRDGPRLHTRIGALGRIRLRRFSERVWPFLSVAEDGSKAGLPIGSIFLFDLGVYLVVLGVICAILFALEEAVRAEADPGGDA